MSGHVKYYIVDASSLELSGRCGDQSSGLFSPERSKGDLCPKGGKRLLLGDGEERCAIRAIHEPDRIMLSTSFTLCSYVKESGFMIGNGRVIGRMLMIRILCRI